jgi:hypothetical protein
MSHARAYGARMNSIRSLSRSPRAVRSSAAPTAARPDLGWIHDGIRYRVTVWPEVSFQREIAPGKWTSGDIGENVFASAALGVTASQWRRYLEYVPPVEREFLLRFEFGRMAALHVITHCPGLIEELKQVPALTPFLTVHLSLRGGEDPRWPEIAAIFERDGIFGVLQWLGLPASRQTLTILGNITDPDISHRLLEPLRAALWDPEAIWALSHEATLTDERLAETCHALAA